MITYGTPHQGSNTSNLSTGLGTGQIADGRSEAARDLRYSYRFSSLGPGRYLYGGAETANDVFFSFDVDADGDEDDVVVGLNSGDPEDEFAVDNPALPLPTDVAYTYLVGRILGIGDGVVDADRQVLQRLDDSGGAALVPEGARRVITGRSHVQQTSDADTILEALATVTAGEPPAADVSLGVVPNPVARGSDVWLDLPRPRPCASWWSTGSAARSPVSRTRPGAGPAGSAGGRTWRPASTRSSSTSTTHARPDA